MGFSSLAMESLKTYKLYLLVIAFLLACMPLSLRYMQFPAENVRLVNVEVNKKDRRAPRTKLAEPKIELPFRYDYPRVKKKDLSPKGIKEKYRKFTKFYLEIDKDPSISRYYANTNGSLTQMFVNGSRVNIRKLGVKGSVTKTKFFSIDLNPLLNDGTNQVDLVFSNTIETRATFELLTQPAWMDGDYVVLYLLIGVALTIVLATPLARRELDMVEKLILVGFTLALIAMSVVLPYDLVNDDLRGHIDYMYYIAKHATLPPLDDGWESYQPPLYYLMLVPFYLLGDYLDLLTPYKALPLLTMIGYMVICLYTIALFRMATANRYLVYFCALIFCALPAVIQHALKINNDQFVHVFGVICFYYVVRWRLDGNSTGWWTALCFAMIALCVKGTAFLLVAAVIALPVYEWIIERKPLARFCPKKDAFYVTLLVLLITLGANLGRDMLTAYDRPTDTGLFTGRLEDHQRGWTNTVRNDSWKNFFIFSLDDYLHDKGVVYMKVSNQSRYYWNSHLKTVHNGKTWNFAEPHSLVLHASFLAVFLYFTAMSIIAFFRSSEARKILVPVFIFIGVSLAGSIYKRAVSPLTSWSDPRYISYIVVLYILLYLVALSSRQPEWLRKPAMALGVVMFAASVVKLWEIFALLYATSY